MKNKRKIIVISIISIILLLTLGISVAFFSYLKQGQSESKIEVGDLTFHYTEISGVGHGINIEDAFPISDSEGKSLTGEGNYFDFRIEANLIQSDMIYTVSVEETEESNLPLDAIKVYLTEKEGNEEIELNSNLDGLGKVKTLDDYENQVIYQERILKNTKNYEKNFRVRMWISEDIEYDTNEYMNKTGSFRINVNAYSNKSMVNVNTPVPVITGGTGEVWTTSQPTISVVISENIAGIRNYEYYVTDNSEDIPDDTTLATDTTLNQYQVSRIGKNYVYYRTVTQTGEKSGWSNVQVVYYDNTNYTITYNLNGGTQGANAVTSYNVETPNFNLPTPTRTGYTFGGWYDSTGYEGGEVTQIEKGSRGNKNYYAKWTINTYVATISVGTGLSTSASSVNINYASTQTVTITPSVGYYLSSVSCTNGYTTNATTGVDADKEQIITIANNSNIGNSTCTFTATTKNTVYVKSDGNDTTGTGSQTKPYATLSKAYTNVANNGTIKLLSNITVNSQTNFTTANKTVTLTSNSGTYTVTRGSSDTTYMIWVGNGTVTATNITFDGNNVSSTRCLIGVGNNSSATLNLNTGTTIKRSVNTTSNNGGGIWVGAGATLNINGATISNNKTANQGAGIYVNRATVNFKSGTISNNTFSDSDSRGGGVYCYGCDITMSGGTISNNIAERGGGVNVIKATAEPLQDASLTITGGTISSNTAYDQGAGIYSNLATVDIKNGTITANKFSNSDGGNGGGLFCWQSTCSMSGGTISDHNSGTRGGAGVYVGVNANTTNNATFTMTGGTIKNNKSESNSGGGVYVYSTDDVNTTATFTMNAGTISENSAKYGGGVYTARNKSTFNFNGGNVSSNTASSYGGGVFISWGSKLNMTNGNINNNTSSSHGAGLGIYDPGTAATISGGNIYSNTTTASGGGIVVSSSATLTMTGGTVYSNSSKNGGGISVLNSATAYLKGGTFRNNSATVNGGAIDVYDNSKMYIQGASIINNTCSAAGSYGVHINGTDNTYSFTSGTISGNTPNNSNR